MKTGGLFACVVLCFIFLSVTMYTYLMWTQFTHYASSNAKVASDSYHNTYQFEDEDTVVIKEGNPRFHFRNRKKLNKKLEKTYKIFDNFESNPQKEKDDSKEVKHDNKKETPQTTQISQYLNETIIKHKNLIITTFRRFKINGRKEKKNPFDVNFEKKINSVVPTRKNVLCALKNTSIQTLQDGDEPFTSDGLGMYFPHTKMFEGRRFSTCAVVSSANSLLGSNLGEFIDSHEMVMRFNHAPTKGFETDVGSKTTVRVLNHVIVDTPIYDFLRSPLYKNITLLVWGDSDYSADLNEFYRSEMYDSISEYFRRRLMLPNEDFYYLHPKSVWALWDVLQIFTDAKILPNPPSSGFIGTAIMLHHCDVVNIMEFVPSIRMSKNCHYWDTIKDDACTVGGWHPTYAEKGMIMALTEGDDFQTFQRGITTITGLKYVKCS